MPLLKRPFGFVLAALSVAFAPITGCGRLKQQVKAQMDSDPHIREQVVANARESCVKTASEKLKDQRFQPQIASYCDCFATKGLNSFSNSELAGVALHGGQLNTEQQSRMNVAVQMCASTLLTKPAKTHD